MISLPKIVLGVIFTAAVFYTAGFNSTAYAQAPPATTPATPATPSDKDIVLQALGGSATDISGVSGTCTSFAAQSANPGIVNLLSGRTCGEIAAADGKTFRQRAFSKGDTVKCNYSINAELCAITKPGEQTLYYNTGILSSVDTDSNDNSTSYSRLGASVAETAKNALSTVGTDVIKAVAGLILVIANFLLGLAGTLLNWMVVKTIFQFASIEGNSPGVLVAWGILRDIGNMILLFGFIFIGIATVLNLQTYSAKKAIPRLIIFAILMNFSLFAAEAVIDISNGLTATLYQQSNTACVGTTAAGSSSYGQATASLDDCAINYGIAGQIMQQTGLSTVFAVDTGSIANNAAVLIGLALFATIGAVVLFAASIMLAIRVITLTFIMVMAPIGFAGMAIPPLQSLANKWWHALIHQAFFAPILFLLILVSLKVSETFTNSTADRSLAGALSNPNASVIGIILVFALVIGFLIASLIAARSFGAMGAGFAVNLATRYAFGGVSRGTNFAIGGAAYGARYLQQTKLGQKVPGGAFVNKRILTPLTKTNFDLRRTPGLGKALGAAGAGDAAKPGEHSTFEDTRHMYQDIRDNKAGQQRENEYQARIKAQRLEDESHGTDLSEESKKTLAGMNEKALIELHGIKEASEALAKNLSPDQFEALMKSDKLNDTQKANLKSKRYAELVNTAKNGTTDEVKAIVGSMTKKDLENAPAELFDPSTPTGSKFLEVLNDKQRDDLGGSDKRSASERGAVRSQSPQAKLEAIFRDPAPGRGPAAAAAGIRGLTPTQVGKLSVDVLRHADIAQQFTPGMLMEIQETKKLKAADISHISTAIALGGDPKAQAFISFGPPKGAGADYWS